MNNAIQQISGVLPLPLLRPAFQPNVADQVFGVLQQRILSLELPPKTKLSEADVAQRMGVSRQPVREAFKRLAQLGFLEIRPQSGTNVSLISEQAILNARFIRLALEEKTCRQACETVSDEGLIILADNLKLQKAAIKAKDRVTFHGLDDAFHREICMQTGVGFVWELIRENKGHMDRMRMLTLDGVAQQQAFHDHTAILTAISARDSEAASVAIDRHLSRILLQIDNIKQIKHHWFEGLED